jgi:hypothetical protein
MLRAFDCEARRYHGASHVSQLVLRLDADFEHKRLHAVIEAVALAAPIIRSPVRRPFFIGSPVYQSARAPGCATPRVRMHDLSADDAGSPPEVFFEAINQPFAIGRGELLRVDLVRYDGGTAGSDLVLSWAHLLLDGAGSEGFVRGLDELDRQPSSAELSCGENGTADAPPMRERGQRSVAWQRHIQSFAQLPTRSLAGPRHRVRQRLRYRHYTFSREDTRRIVDQAKSRAGFMTPMLYYMAAAIRAHHALFAARGEVPSSYVVPLPVNTRPRGGTGAVFRTHVSLIWFQVRSSAVDDFDALLEELKRQRHRAIRDGHIESGLYAMDFARIVPKGIYANIVRNTLGGELCSFFFAYTGAFLGGLESFLGTPIRNGFHVPGVPPSPGSCVAMSLWQGKLNLTHVYQQDAVTEDELDLLRDSMRAELLRAGTA